VVSNGTLIALYDTAPVIHSFGSTKIVRLWGHATEGQAAHRILTCEAELLLHKLFDKRGLKSAPEGTWKGAETDSRGKIQ
jgi:hypothetical protein